MGKALYILEYQLNVQHDRFTESDGFISVTAEIYDEAVESARTRLPKEKGEVEEFESSYMGPSRSVKKTFCHSFKLKDCLDENHALFVPHQQEINVDNSSASYSSSTSLNYRRGLFS